MKALRRTLTAALIVPIVIGSVVFAQETPAPHVEPIPEMELPEFENTVPDPNQQPESENENSPNTNTNTAVELEGVLNTRPDYSHLTTTQERTARLDALFERLKSAETSDAAELIAEEIWALWLDSGSATVNMILLRGTAFEKRGETQAARRMYDHVTTLLPEYAEGWARSARLALEEEDYDRALAESAKALIYEPREFYALWTMGNVLEKLGRSDQALETYEEALELYPTHPAIKSRVGILKTQIDGEVL